MLSRHTFKILRKEEVIFFYRRGTLRLTSSRILYDRLSYIIFRNLVQLKVLTIPAAFFGCTKSKMLLWDLLSLRVVLIHGKNATLVTHATNALSYAQRNRPHLKAFPKRIYEGPYDQELAWTIRWAFCTRQAFLVPSIMSSYRFVEGWYGYQHLK